MIFYPFTLFTMNLSFEKIGGYEENAVYSEVKVIGGFGFLVAKKNGVHIFDLSNPHMPRKISEIESTGRAYSIDIQGLRLFLADGSGGLRIFDIRDKKNPRQISFVPTNYSSLDLQVSGDYCYVAEGKGGLRIIDISKPLFPREISNWNQSGNVIEVKIIGDFAYLATEKGVSILKVTTPDSIENITSISGFGAINKVVSDGRLLFACNVENDLLVSDISDVKSPLTQKVSRGYSEVKALFLSGFHLYVVRTGAVDVYSILIPFNPQVVGRAIFTGGVVSVYVSGNLLYAASGFDGLEIIKILER